MKKISAIVLLSIILFSCKKETATVTKVDPKTGKTVTVEVPKDSVIAVAESPAISDSVDVFHQSFKLEKGKTYPLTTVQKDAKTITAPTGESQSGTSENTDVMTFTVTDIKDNIYDITINLVSKKNSQSANGKSIVIDTKGAAPKEEDLKMMWNVNKAIMGNKLQMKLKKNGEIVSITGFDAIYNKVNAFVETTKLSKEEKQGFKASLKNSFNEEIIKDQFVKNIMLFPKKGAKVGEKWTNTENASPDGSIKITTTYQLKSVGNGTAVIGLSGGIPKKSEKNTQNGLTRTLSSELSQNGTITLDQNTGWIKTQNISVKTSQTETITDGKQTQSMKSNSTSSVLINP